MSRTIETKSGSNFFTNVSSERLIGKLCKMVDAKHYSYTYENLDYTEVSMAYDMTKEETKDTADKLRTLLDKEDFYEEVKSHFGKNGNNETFRLFILDTIKDFEDSNGYECLG